MVVIPQKVVVIRGQPQEYAEDYMRMCTIIATVQAILPYKQAVMSESQLEYINTLSLILFP